MQPDKNTIFLPFSEIEKYCNEGYECGGIVFSPGTENNHFPGCPPYIELFKYPEEDTLFFRVPETIAYYGSGHAGYTMAGRKRAMEQGRYSLQEELRNLLGIESGD